MSVPIIQHDDTADVLDLGLPGGALATSNDGGSAVRTNIGEPPQDEQTISFPGLDGEFAACHGVRGRVITLNGTLRLSDAGLASVISQRDDFKKRSGTFTFTDDTGTDYAGCRFKPDGGFTIGQKIAIIDPHLKWTMPFAITLIQMEP